MKIIVSHPSSNQFSRALVANLIERKILLRFFTAIAIFPNQLLYKFGKIGMLKDINRRSFDQSFKKYTSSNPILEIGRLITPKLKLKRLTNHETGIFCTDKVYQSHDRWVAKNLSTIKDKTLTSVYAYEDGALESFLKAKELGLKCIYDLPIAYWETGRELLKEEVLRYPKWADTMIGGATDSQNKLNRKIKELQLADFVVVPSYFVLDSLPTWVNREKVIVSPFGSPIYCDDNKYKSVVKKEANAPLRVLFVGSMGQRKGLADLFAAMRLLNTSKIELVVLGSLIAPLDFYKNEFADFRYEKGRPHEEVLALMRSCDVFCLPSIVEGRALVMQEAMSQGLPLVITANTGGKDLIIEGETGFLVPIRSPEAIASKLNWFLENRADIPEMGKKAQVHAAQYTWDKYAETIVNGIADFL
ncbi:glycosyltransferase family 4 protein [Flavobacterium sp. 120]|uniref:glycosyltransferase family 4 protein n=1 Tax=Flavobacterium sp. 120 TaxID=2135626 RepID=UPI000EB382AF|nr:glycosyltransferase family 4 protein [Flavobacterium sp. 120]RKS13305.1 glycosyl transferase family 1 [Flavobacterium sp. 120]